MRIIKNTITIAICMVLIIFLKMQNVHAADYSNAVSFTMNGQWSGDYYLTDTNNEHWYKFTMPGDGYVEFKFMAYMWDSYYDLYSEDLSIHPLGNRVLGGTVTAPCTSSPSCVIAKGTYYLKVTGNTGKYKIWGTISETYGNNDAGAVSYDSPQVLALSSEVIGSFTPSDSEDWFKLTIDKDGYYTLSVTTYMWNLYYDLYNYDLSIHSLGNRVLGGARTAPVTVKEDVVLSKGVYYFKFVGDYGKYKFSFSELTPNNCTHDYEAEKINATYFANGYTQYTCKKCGNSYIDDYTNKLILGKCSFSQYYTFSGKKRITATWYSVKDATGYELAYATKKNFKNQKTLKVKKTKRIIKSLKKKKKYYIRVRAYIQSGSKKAYGAWSDRIWRKTR